MPLSPSLQTPVRVVAPFGRRPTLISGRPVAARASLQTLRPASECEAQMLPIPFQENLQMHCHQLHTTARPTSLNDNASCAAAYGRTAVGHGFDASAPRFSDEGVGAQWMACRVAAQSDGYRIAETPDFLFGDDGVSGRASRRPELDRLLDVVRSGHAPFSRLYITDIARISRDDAGVSFLHRLENELASQGIEVRFLTGNDAFVDSSSRCVSLSLGVDRPTGH